MKERIAFTFKHKAFKFFMVVVIFCFAGCDNTGSITAFFELPITHLKIGDFILLMALIGVAIKQ